MKKKRFPTRVLLGSVAGLAVVVVVAWLAYISHKNFEDTVVSQTQQQLLMSARTIAVGIEEFIAEHLQVLRTISRHPAVQERAYKGILAKEQFPKYCVCQDHYEEHKDHIDAFNILDAKGIMLRRLPYV